MHITVTVSDAAARGALFYDISFGDGTSAAAFAPQYCRPLPRAAHQTWHLEHRYTTAGAFRLEVKVSAVCTPGNAAVSVRLRVH